MRFIFVAEEHQEYGMMGWRLKSQPGFDPLQGMAVAHDVLEHLPGGTDSPADEFQALGASWLIRGEGSMFRNGGAENLGADMPDIMGHIRDEGMPLPPPPRTCRLDGPDDNFDIAIKEALAECMYRYEGEAMVKVREEFRKAKGWMRVGYRRALKRYKGKLGLVRGMFSHIEEQADKYLKRLEPGVQAELHVSVCLASGDCKVRYQEVSEEIY